MSRESQLLTCQSCGEPLEAGWDQCPACLTPTSSGALTCPNCGSAVKEKWRICPKCKTPLEGWATPTSGGTDSGAIAGPESEGVFLSMAEAGPSPQVGFGLELPIEKGDVLGDRYTVRRGLGAGGFGAVYLVDDSVLKEEIALKVVVAGEGRAERAVEQILHEFKLRERISETAHIIRAQDPRPCEYKGLSLVLLPMELAAGGSLRAWLSKNSDAEKRRQRALDLFRQACEGIRAIHDAGLVHLDLKPANILLVEDRAKVADFGIGRFCDGQFSDNPDQLLRQGLGTPQYMSPEQFHAARQRDIGAASDIYSLGVILYEILDGSLPFDGTPIELRDKHLNTPPSPLRGAAERWWRIAERCLRKNPEERYTGAQQLIRDLERASQGAAISVDVSCPACGHISANPNARECEQCRKSLASLFRPCPTCAREVRLDVESCPGCGKSVAAHYLLQERRAEIERLQDEDPVETIELLELVLREGADDFQERAVELIRELRSRQAKISALIDKATKASAAGEPERALEAWRGILNIVPRHTGALKQADALEALLKKFQIVHRQACDLLDTARFEEGAVQLRECLEMIPKHEETRKLLGASGRRAKRFATALDQANVAAQQSLLLEAQGHLSTVLKQAPRSPEATALSVKVEETLKTTAQMLEPAEHQLAKAEFKKAEDTVREIEALQSDNRAVPELKKRTSTTQSAFTRNFEAAKEARQRGDLDQALKGAKDALKNCPHAAGADSLLREVEKEQKEALQWLKDASAALKRAQFDKATHQLQRVALLWPMISGLDEAKRSLAEKRPAYERNFAEAKALGRRSKWEQALDACERALHLCPKSEEARSFRDDIREAISDAGDRRRERSRRSRERSEHARKVTLATAKWTGLLLAVLIVLGGIGVGSLFGWKWVRATAWPWALAQPFKIGLAAAVAAALAALIHWIRGTEFHWDLYTETSSIETRGGAFFASTVIFVIVAGALGLAVGLALRYYFEWAGAVALTGGCLMSLAASVLMLVHSFFAAD